MSYATLADLKRYLDIVVGNVIDDDLLTAALESASAIIDNETHRTFVAASDTTRYLDAIKDVDGRRLWLGGDLAQLTSVTNGDGATIPLNAILYEPDEVGEPDYALILRGSSGLSWTYDQDSEGAIAIVGRWAWSVTPPPPIQQATKRLAAWLYRQRDNALDLDRTVIVGTSVLTPAAIPVDVMTIIRPYMARVR
jgi:hypothetical protein